MAFNFLKVGKCDICGRQTRNFFLDAFTFMTVQNEMIKGRYCWRCSFRYDRYNYNIRKNARLLGSYEFEKEQGGE